jgi:hypothetical protein
VELQKRIFLSLKNMLVLGRPHSQRILSFKSSAITKWDFEDHALTDELGLCRTREAYALTRGERGHEAKYRLFAVPPRSKRHCVGFENANIFGTKPSVEQNMADTQNTNMCLNSKACECS